MPDLRPASLLPPAFSPRGAWLRALAWFGLTRMPQSADAPVHRRVRVAMYLVLLVVGSVTAWQTWRMERSEQVRQVDAELIRVAAAQSTLTQRMGMLAALMAMADGPLEERGNALAETLNRAQERAARLEELLRQQGAWVEGAAPELRRAIFEWQERRERLWYRAQLLIWHSDRNHLAKLVAAIKTFQDEVEPMLAASQELLEQVQQAAQERARGAITQVELSALLMLLLLVLLLLAVAEPLARFVKRQHEAMANQAVEVQRLALVAQRTANWVAVLDRERRVIWCNDSMLRAKGCTLDSLVGKMPGLLVANQHMDEANLERVRATLRQGLSLRIEILYQAPDGREIWLDTDYQPIRDAAGVLQGFTVVATDITERVNERLRTHTLLDALPAAVLLYDLSGVAVDCNQAAVDLLGLPREQLLGDAIIKGQIRFVHDDMTQCEPEELAVSRALRTGRPVGSMSRGVVAASGEVRWLMVNAAPLHDATGHMTGVAACLVDVTELRAQQKLLSLALEGASLGVWQWDIVTGEMTCNDRLLSLYGYEQGGLGMHVDDWTAIIHPDDLPGWKWAIRANLKDSRQPLHWEIRIQSGSQRRWIWMMYSGTVVARDAQGRALRMAGICYDINAQKELEEQLRHAARTDTLTRLPNRGEVLTRIHASIQRRRQHPGYHFAVLFMDFDRFKQVNDTLGHNVGDELLRQIAQRLRDSLRPSDAFVRTSDFGQMAARLGGDEFVVLLDDIRGDLDAQVVASRLLETLAEPYQIGTHRVSSTASIGIVTSQFMTEDADSVLRDADIAMYEAKREGRGRYVMFDPTMRKRLRDDVSLENDLRQALAQDEMFVVYQPLVRLSDGHFAGLEALVRWQHPQRGLVSPQEFISVAETNGMINDLGYFVLNRACEEFMQLQRLLGDQAPATVAVNLSRAQLRQPGFITDLSDALTASGVLPEQLILEVTESLAAQDETLLATLGSIRALGISLSLDDFGTGYSSLSCLHQLPVNVVKIDQSFVREALHSDYHRVMIEATIRMANTLGLGTVAEGIETAAQADLMRNLGCDKGQGYLYSPPLKAADLVRWAQLLGEPA